MMQVCPCCHSVDGLAFCPECGTRLAGSPGTPLFVCTLGWSRSREYESTLSRFRQEKGYHVQESGDEIHHQVPLADLAATEDLVRRYPRAMLWKETRLSIGNGESFNLHEPVGVCFLRHILEESAPCLRGEGCPFLGPLDAPATLTEARRLAAFLQSRRAALFCPHAWELVRKAAAAFPEPEAWPFLVAEVKSAMKNGLVILDSGGNWTPRSPETVNYDVKWPQQLPQNVTWATMSGDLELGTVDDQLRAFPGTERIVLWGAASLVAPTDRGRHVILPPVHANEPEFIIYCEGQPPVRCGPFPVPFAMDSMVGSVACITEGRVVLMSLASPVDHPFWIQLGTWDAPSPARQLVTENGDVAILCEGDRVCWYSMKGEDRIADFPGCMQILFTRSGVLAVLWQDGRKLAFMQGPDDRMDLDFLVPVHMIFPTSTGNVVCQSDGRLTEITIRGEILDFRCGDALWMTSRGYMERSSDRFIWHVLDQEPLEDRYWREPPGRMKVVRLPGGYPAGPRAELLLELVSYFLSSEMARMESGGWSRLVNGAPSPVRKQLEILAKSYPWLADFDREPENWPIAETDLEDFRIL